MARDDERFGRADGEPTRYFGHDSAGNDRTEYLGRTGNDRTEYLGRGVGNDGDRDSQTRYLGPTGGAGAGRGAGADAQRPRQYIPPVGAQETSFDSRAWSDDGYSDYDDGHDGYSDYDDGYREQPRGRRSDLSRYQEPARRRGAGAAVLKILGLLIALAVGALVAFLVGRSSGDAASTPQTVTEQVTSTQRTTVTEEPTEDGFRLPSELPSFDRSELPSLPEGAPTDEAELREWFDGLLDRFGGEGGADGGAGDAVGEPVPETAG